MEALDEPFGPAALTGEQLAALYRERFDEVLGITGFEVTEVIPRFLPYTIKYSRLPRSCASTCACVSPGPCSDGRCSRWRPGVPRVPSSLIPVAQGLRRLKAS